MTAPARLLEKTKKPRRSRTRTGPVLLPFPVAAPGQAVSVGLGSWATYLTLDEALCRRGFRVRYHRGKIEIMSISFSHEFLKKVLGLLIETFCDCANLDFVPWGSTTQKVENEMGGEPDDSYTFGPVRGKKPDMVLEVALSRGGIEKLPFWAEKEIPEVWIWQKNRLHVYGLQKGAYVPLTQSKCLPGFPIHLAEKMVSIEPPSKAAREFRRRLAEKK